MQPDPYMHLRLHDEEQARALALRALVREANLAARRPAADAATSGYRPPSHRRRASLVTAALARLVTLLTSLLGPPP